MQIPITGQAYQHPSQDVNFQRCVNMFVSPAGTDGRGGNVLLPTPGLIPFIDTGKDEIRGILNVNGTLYCVASDTLYKLAVDEIGTTATKTAVGTLTSTTGLVAMAYNPTQIMITDGSATGYIYDYSIDSFVAISDLDFTGASQVIFSDSYFIYNTPSGSTVFSTGINNGTTIDALDVSTAEGVPDTIVGIAVDKRELWLFGRRSVEIWYDAANAVGFPFSRREGAFFDIGCAASESILNIDNTMIFLDHRGVVQLIEAYQPRPIATPAITAEIQSYKTISDAYAYQYTDRGQLFYVITFPSAKKTWAFDLVTHAWHEKAYTNPDGDLEHHLGQCSEFYNTLNLIGDRKSGIIYIMSSKAYDDNGTTIERIRTTSHQNQEFKQVGVDVLKLRLETGKALVTGQGSDPQIMLRYSNDGGYTWSYEIFRSIGQIGQYGKPVEWCRLGTGRQWIFELKISDPIPFAIIEGSVEVSGGVN